jgi:pyruvate dehydrogenase E2 component (dihydrolipoamide acetyltransferase)
MITKFAMPQVSITSAEVKLVHWLKKVGDPVKKGDALAEVETEKATIEVESYVDGYLRKVFFEDYAVVPVGETIAILTTTADEKMEEQSAPQAPPVSVEKTAVVAGKESPAAGQAESGGRIAISPAARKLAAEREIDFTKIRGTGPEGRITLQDVEAVGRQAAPVPEAGAGALEKISSMRQAIAQKTGLSKATIPHYYVTMEFEMDGVMRLIEGLKRNGGKKKVEPPTVTDVIVWACGQVLPQFPLLNSSWEEGGARRHVDVNIGLVMGMEEGLMVPVVHKAQTLSLFEISDTTKQLKQKAKSNALSDTELVGSTFTISNLGMFGVDAFIAVINPPESAILALGAIVRRPVADESGKVVVRSMMTGTLSADHRLIDGIVAAKFMGTLKAILADPQSQLIGSHA